MNQLLRVGRLTLLIGVAISVSSSTVSAEQKAAPPNWKVSAVGTSTFDSITVVDGVPLRTDIDSFSGHSSHLGEFTATGQHVLNLVTFHFDGVATYTAANGDQIYVTYSGQLDLSGDTDFPYGVAADAIIIGGTGRFASATGSGKMTGGFTGEVPVGDFFISIDGTLKTR